MSYSRSFFRWTVLGCLLFVLTFGLDCGFLIMVHAVALILGSISTCVYFGKRRSDFLYGKPQPVLRPASRGIEAVLELLRNKTAQAENLDKRLTGASAIDEVLQEIIEYIFRDYIHSWYQDVSMDMHFPLELRKMLHAAIVNFATQAKNINWVPYVTEELVDEIASHIKLYRQAEEFLRKESKFYGAPDAKYNEKLESKFFDLETEMEKNTCRDLVCTDKHKRKLYLQNISEALLFLLFPESSFNSRVLRYLAREVFVNAVFDPAVELLTDPDYVNQCIIWMTADSAFNRESFLGAMKTSDSIEELTAILEKVEHETTCHRAKDKGGADDASIKQVLSSLNYVKKVAEARLRVLESRAGDDEVDCNFMSLGGAGNTDLSSSLPLQVLLNTAAGVQYFNDYLITHDYEMYLNFLYDIECYLKVAAEQQQQQSSSGSSVSALDDRELSEMCHDIYSKYTSPEVVSKMNMDGELISNYRKMVHSAKPTLEIFELMRTQVLEKLEVIYAEFKMDRLYQRLLRELRLNGDVALEAVIIDDTDSASDDRRNSAVLTEESFSLSAHIVRSDTVKEKEEKPYTLYVIQVTQIFEGRPSHPWQTKRRYKEFDEFRTFLNGKYADLASLPFPGKKPFNNMGKEFLEKRASALNIYLQALLKAERQSLHAGGLLDDLISFLQPGAWSKEKHIQRAHKLQMESAGFYVAAAVKGPSAGTKVSADVFGELLQGVGRMFKAGRTSSSSVNSSHKVGAQLDLSGSDDDNIPLRIMLLLFDEVFDLRRKNQWFRRRIVAILRQIVKATLGDSINRRILEHVDEMLSANRIAEYLRMLRDALWPGGCTAEARPPRDAACRQRTRVVCIAKMLDTVADEVRRFIGSDTTNRGVLRVFSMFQHQALNRRLLFVIAEGVFRTMFPNNSFEKVFREMHSWSERVHRRSSSSLGSSSGSVSASFSTGLELARISDIAADTPSKQAAATLSH